MSANTIHIAIVDDHKLFREGIARLISSLSDDFEIVLEASNGQDFLNRLPNEHGLDVVVVDLDMPIMNGHELAIHLKENGPKLNLLALTMHGEDEQSIIKMIRSGVKGYLSKDVEPDELKAAIANVSQGNFHFNDALSGKMLEIIIDDKTNEQGIELNDRELTFLKLSCSELTYKEIADRMHLSPKTIDGYRAALFDRFEIKSRVGLVLFAIKNEIIELKN
ncbi:MAG: response regulator transcription factor [Crocinitomicaceae bacterium]